MTELNTYGLKPLRKRWKLFEVEGWQCLVTVQEDEEHEIEGRFEVTFEVGFDALGEVTTVRLGGFTEELAYKCFDELNDPLKATKMVLDQAGPMIVKMVAAGELES
jgi:hypothetical protein